MPVDTTEHPPIDLRAFQRIIAERYEANDRARGVARTWLNFSEEVGELARALYKQDQPNIREEMADIVAWLCTLANISDVDLSDALREKYLSESAPTGVK